MTAQSKETLGFQTEVKQLLHLMIHSLYSNKEIFLRELISNASDAADKLRFKALDNGDLYENDGELKVRIETDSDNNSLKISDNGIGMNRDDVINNLGTIAKSGTADFLGQLSGDEKKDSSLIGQFGVGFYSAFIVAHKVEVLTRKAGETEGVRWISEGEGEFSIETVADVPRGTQITLHLREDDKEFSESMRLRTLVRKYSDHIAVPVEMMSEPAPAPEPKEGEEPVEAEAPDWEKVNEATALWTMSRSELEDSDYNEFYKHISHDYTDPMAWAHNKVEGKLEYSSLLYVPAKAPYDLYNRDAARGLKLYVQRVFIMDEAEQFLPLYLRFIKGVVDSNDLSLNVSREILQQDATVTSMKSGLTKRVLDTLKKQAKNEPEKYQTFWNEFGEVLKEGPAEDPSNKDKIAALFRFATTHTDTDAQDQSLDQYIERMGEGQEKIFYLCAESHTTAKSSPHLEVFRKKGIEVVLLSDRVDEWLMSHLTDFNGKHLQDISKGELDLGEIETEEDKKAVEEASKSYESLITQMKDELKDDVEEVRVTNRLTDSPACLVVGAYDMGAQMRKIMEAAGQAMPESKPTLELNVEHPLVQKINAETDDIRANDLIRVVYEQAQLAEGAQLKDPAAYVARLNKLLLELSA